MDKKVNKLFSIEFKNWCLISHMKIMEIFDLFLRDIKSKILKITRADHEEHSIHIGIYFDNKILQNIFDVRAKSFRTQISMSHNAHLDVFFIYNIYG